MLLFLFTIISVDVIIDLSYEAPLKNYYNRKSIRNNRNQRRDDYNYKDWEDKKEDYYQILFSTTNKSEYSTSSLPPTFTLPSISTEVTSPLTILQTSTVTTTLASQLTSTTSIATTTSITTTTSIATTTSVLIPSPEVPSIDDTSDFLEVTTDDIFDTNFTIAPSTTKPIENHIIYEIRRIKKEKREGSFTASLMLLLKVAIAKDAQQLHILLNALNTEVMRLNTNHQLMVFGSDVMGRVTAMAVNGATSDVEQVRATLNFIYNCIRTRYEGSVYNELNAIMDVTDNIYNEDDIKNVADVIRDLINFPNTTKQPESLAKNMGEAFIFKPYKRILGTTKERLLLMEIDNAVKKLSKAEMWARRNIDETKYVKTTATTKSLMDYIIESNYVKNKTVMGRVNQKMKKYKYMRMREKKKKISRGKTTISLTTTQKPTIHKSKYYIRKYSRKILSKMRTTTVRTVSTRDPFKYYGKIKKKKVPNRKNMENIENSRSYYEESGEEDYYSDEDYDNVFSDNDKKDERVKNKYKDLFTNASASNFGRNNIKSFDLNHSNEEVKLKANLQDALIHSEYKNMDHRRMFMEKLIKCRESDDELLLKRNIYNAFGYKDNFGLA